MVPKMVYTTILHAVRLMKFLSVRNGASGPQKKGWALPDEPSLKRKKIKLFCQVASL